MREIFDDRRQEPRFSTRGTASFTLAERPFQAEVRDMSLNGIKVSRPEGCAPDKDSRFQVELAIPGADPFTAEVAVVHAEADELGLEFHDMPPRDFSVLATLIEQYARNRRLSGLAEA